MDPRDASLGRAPMVTGRVMSMMGSPLRVGLVGAGRWGTNYLQAIPATAKADLTCVCDIDAAARARARATAPSASVVSDLSELIEQVDAVVVATPAVTHAAIAIRCIDAGRHVLVEKPLATDLGAARVLVERAAEAGCTLATGHLTLQHPALEALRSLLDRDAIGDIRSVEARRTSAGAKHRRESALWSLGPHDIANVLFVTRAHAPRVQQAWARGLDEMGLVMELAGDVRVELSWHRSAAAPERSLRIVGTEGEARFDEVAGTVIVERGLAGERQLFDLAGSTLLSRQCHRFLDQIAGRIAAIDTLGLPVVRILSSAESLLAHGDTGHKLSVSA